MSKEHIKTRSVLWGTCIALAIGLAGSFLMASLLYLTSFSETYMPTIGSSLYILGAFAGGYYAAKKSENRGLLLGVEVGGLYYLVALLCTYFGDHSSLTILNASLKAIYTLLVSVAGAVVGIALGE